MSLLLGFPQQGANLIEGQDFWDFFRAFALKFQSRTATLHAVDESF